MVGSESTRKVALGLQALSVAALLAFGLYLVVHDAADGPVDLFDRYLYCSLITAAALLCIGRAVAERRERVAWAFIGANLLVWAIGEIYWATALADDPNAPFPSLEDAFALWSYPLSFIGIALLVKARARRFRAITWLDGTVAALTVAAFGAAVLLPKVIDALEGPLLGDAVTLAYPVGDTLLLGFLLSVMVLLGWHLDRSWALIAASLALLPLADAVYAYQDATGTYVEGGVIDFMFPLSAVLMGLAAWAPSGKERILGVRGWRSIATPAVFALAASALLLAGYAAHLNGVAIGLAALALLGATARLSLTYRDNQRLFEEARTDALTGLGNRSALMLDLQEALADRRDRDPAALVMFDLNGFKLYNDTFGHPAGDALLSRLSKRLDQATGGGNAYRIGGDEFCTLIEPSRDGIQRSVSRATASLRERGEAFEVDAAYGYVLLGEEVHDALDAIQIADRRMYENKNSARSSARSQAHEVLMRVLRERQPDLGAHVEGVAAYAVAVAKRLGIAGESLDVLTRAAALHDIGKLAIPDAVLDKPAALDPDEWRFIHDHTVVGERILREATALAPVAELVRSSHERWDGKGYPDRLAGEKIPLGSRIIFVCDAFHAMTSERPYAPAVPEKEAVAELRRCAGTQFDPKVVEAFRDVLTAPSRPATAPEGARAAG